MGDWSALQTGLGAHPDATVKRHRRRTAALRAAMGRSSSRAPPDSPAPLQRSSCIAVKTSGAPFTNRCASPLDPAPADDHEIYFHPLTSA